MDIVKEIITIIASLVFVVLLAMCFMPFIDSFGGLVFGALGAYMLWGILFWK